MPVSMSVKVEGIEALKAKLDQIAPAKHPEWVSKSLVTCGLLVQDTAATKKIIPGGKGPPHPTKLTSRTGTLRRSIRVNRSPLPFAIEIGTDLIYGAVHETGGRFHPARPYLQPALDDSSKDFSGLFSKELQRIIDR